MGRVENQLEYVRGQVEELTGRLQAMAAQLSDLSDFGQWLNAQLRGRALEVRGKGRQAIAVAKMRAEEMGGELPREKAGAFPILVIAGVGAGVVAAVAIFWPEISTQFRARFGWLFGRMEEVAERGRQPIESAVREAAERMPGAAERV